MAAIKDSLAYLLSKYPHAQEQSNARVTKMLYLADWYHCLQTGRQVTDVSWFFDNYGPFVNDVKATAERNPELFEVAESSNDRGKPKTVVRLKNEHFRPQLTQSEMDAIDHVVNVTSKLYWNDFIKTIYGTYPIVSSPRYTNLDLKKKALEYREQLAATA